MVGFILHTTAVLMFVVVGLTFPHATASALSEADTLLTNLANTLNASGRWALVLQFAGGGFVVVMAALILAAGISLRRIYRRFFRWSRIVMATVIPFFAHALKWGLGLWWPALLVPVQQLSDFIIGQLEPGTQVTVGLFHARDHLMTIIIGITILFVLLMIRITFRRNRVRRTPTTTPPTGGTRKDFSMFNPPKGWRLLFSPVWFAWWLLTLPFRKMGHRGIYLGPISIWIFLTGIFWFAALSVLFLLWIPRLLLGNAGWSDLQILIVMSSGLAIVAVIWLVKLERSNVKTSKILALTILGFRVRAYLKEGDYYINLKNFLIGATQKAVVPFTEEVSLLTPDVMAAALAADVVTFPLWDSSDGNEGKPNLRIKLNSKGGAGVTLSVTLKGRLCDPQQVLSADDAALLLGDSARKALRHASGKFIDFDIDNTPGLLSALMFGETVISARLSDTYNQHREGSLLFDKNGNRYFKVVKPGDDMNAARLQFLTDISTLVAEGFFDPVVMKLCSEGGNLRTEAIKIESTMVSTAHEIGFPIEEILVSDVQLSEASQKAAEQASAEALEAYAEMKTAQSARTVARIYRETEDLYGRDAAVIGASATGAEGIRTYNIPGLTELGKALGGVIYGKGTTP